ncbi:MAG TPA: stilbene synthase [Opitutaceae bacterium]|nr:stilbene synthase [Opitutaceae bacterium]
MYLHALATAVPPTTLTQRQCWELGRESPALRRLSRRSQLILRSILTGDSGIATRHFAVNDIPRVFDLTEDELNAAFRREAPRLAGAALSKALTQAGLRADQLDALFVCTCTGYLCPGVTSYVAEQLGLRADAILHDLVGLGCGAAIPTLRAASHLIAARPEAVVACVAVEICSAAFYLDDDFGVLVSACLFSDGAAATIWRGRPGPTGLRSHGFRSLHRPENRDLLRFETRQGKLRNLLDRSVPAAAAAAVGELFAGERAAPPASVLVHPGGRDVLEAIAPVLPGYPLDASHAVLSACGNMSSPSVLFVLEEHLRSHPASDGDLWLVSFGAGFSAHACRLSANGQS